MTTLLVYGGADGAPGRWLLVGADGVAARGDDASETPPAGRRVLAVPGEQAALHWMELGPELTTAQAAAAARLGAAVLSAEPIAAMHVAVGPARDGRRCVALVRAETVAGWIESAKAAGIEPDSVVPDPLLLAPRNGGWLRRDEPGRTLVRGLEAAFALEPEVARYVPGVTEAATPGDADYEAGLAAVLAAPAVDLRQGAFARRRELRLDRGFARRMLLLTVALALATLAVQVATILRVSAAAGSIEEEARRLGGPTLHARLAALRGAGAGFGPTASALFAAVQATPGAELAEIVYEPSGVLRATVHADAPPTLAALRDRLAGQGFRVALGPPRPAGGRQAAELTVTGS